MYKIGDKGGMLIDCLPEDEECEWGKNDNNLLRLMRISQEK